MKFNELLLELNLYNRQPLIDAINKLLIDKRVIKPEIKNWFLKQYVNWFLSSTDDSKKLYWVYIQGDDITPHTYKEGEPEWAKKQGMYDFTRFPYFDEENLKHKIWEGKGIVVDGKIVILGKNKLGNIWMELRDKVER